jgi:short-subunit dehydrogenase
MTRLRDAAVLITGASSGIGAELAREVVSRGGRVGLLARREDRLEALAGELREVGGTAVWAAADVTDPEGFPAALDRISEELGTTAIGADVIVANAGTNLPERPSRFRRGTAPTLYDINLQGMVRMIDWALPRYLEAGRGHIVGISSAASFIGLPGNPSYCGSKAAMRIHLQSLRVTLKRRGIRVTTICPGFVKSELTEDARFSMPFLWETDRAVRLIANAIEKGRGEVIFPWQMRWIVRVSRCFPPAVVEWAVRPR